MVDVAVVRYEEPFESLKKAVELVGGLDDFSPGLKVFIKPNYVIWHEGVDFPKYGVLTTSRLIEDVVRLLRDKGVSDITIVEGIVQTEKNPKFSLMEQAAESLGLNVLKKRHGVKIIDTFRSRFAKVSVNDTQFSVNADILDADSVINMPVLKTHAQCMVSLGIKNLKGLIDIASRKVSHNANPSIDLNYHVSKLAEIVPVALTVIDGIYTLERGGSYNGRAHRSNIIVVSKDLISADKVGARLLGFDPRSVPHIAASANNKSRTTNLRDVNVIGNVDIQTALKPHQYAFEQDEELQDQPKWLIKAGVKGISIPKQDLTICTYCAFFVNYVFMGILMAKNKGKTFDDIEILDGKIQEPSPGHKHTLLVGQCQVKLNRKNPLIRHCVTIPGCPPKEKHFLKAFEELGIELPDNFLEWMKKSPELFHMKKYETKAEFDPSFYKIESLSV